MEVNARAVGKTALKVAGAACVGTGLVLVGAVIASGAAVGSVAEGFVMAKKAVADIWKKDNDEAAESAETETASKTEEASVSTKEIVTENADKMKEVPEDCVSDS